MTGISPSSRRRGDCIKLVRISVPPRSKNAQFAVGQPPSPTPSPEEWFFDAVLSFDSLKGWGWGRLDLSQPHLRRQARHTYTLCNAAVRTLPDPVPAHRQGVQVEGGKGTTRYFLRRIEMAIIPKPPGLTTVPRVGPLERAAWVQHRRLARPNGRGWIPPEQGGLVHQLCIPAKHSLCKNHGQGRDATHIQVHWTPIPLSPASRPFRWPTAASRWCGERRARRVGHSPEELGERLILRCNATTPSPTAERNP